jgi:hypothetical protein
MMGAPRPSSQVPRGTGCEHDNQMVWSSDDGASSPGGCEGGHVVVQGSTHSGDEACPDECACRSHTARRPVVKSLVCRTMFGMLRVPHRGPPRPRSACSSDRRERSRRLRRASAASEILLCLIAPLCSYLYGGLDGGLHERAHIIRYFAYGPGARSARRTATAWARTATARPTS